MAEMRRQKKAEGKQRQKKRLINLGKPEAVVSGFLFVISIAAP
jgi:hypothetical protein